MKDKSHVWYETKGMRGSAWWCHQMETLSALLAICAGNSPVPGEFPTQRPVTRSCDVFFDLRLNKRLSKQSWGWWFETPSHPLWRRSNDMKQREWEAQYELMRPKSVYNTYTWWCASIVLKTTCNNKYRKVSNISGTKCHNLMLLVSSRSCLYAIYWSQVLSGEWRCS